MLYEARQQDGPEQVMVDSESQLEFSACAEWKLEEQEAQELVIASG